MYNEKSIKCCDFGSGRSLMNTKLVPEVRKMWRRKAKKYNIAFSQNCYKKIAWLICCYNLQDNPIARNINI